VTYKKGFPLDDCIYCAYYIHTVRDYKQYSAIIILQTFQFTVEHALGFSVFASRILATGLSQSHCHFKSPNSLLALSCSCQFRRLDSVLFRLLFRTPCYSASTYTLPNTSYNHFARTPQKTRSSVVKNACLLVRYLAMDVLLLLSARVAGICLPTRCLAMGIHVPLFFVYLIRQRN
jgi:hypothetical protein